MARAASGLPAGSENDAAGESGRSHTAREVGIPVKSSETVVGQFETDPLPEIPAVALLYERGPRLHRDPAVRFRHRSAIPRGLAFAAVTSRHRTPSITEQRRRPNRSIARRRREGADRNSRETRSRSSRSCSPIAGDSTLSYPFSRPYPQRAQRVATIAARVTPLCSATVLRIELKVPTRRK